MGPFIIYEYCEHGPLKDYLQSQKSNVTLEVQENLFRFGLDIAKGMEFLASKGVSILIIEIVQFLRYRFVANQYTGF